MPNTKEIRQRIKSVKNISQITKAMQMVAATKMRRAQTQALNGRPYSLILSRVIQQLLAKGTSLAHPLLQPGTGTKTGILLLTTDKSLCGALNTNLFRELQKSSLSQRSESKGEIFYTIGAKGRNFVVKSGKELQADFPSSDSITLAQVRQTRRMLVDDFSSGVIKEVNLVFSNFISTLRQEPLLLKLLPIQPENFLAFLESQPKEKTVSQQEYLFEPNQQALLEFSLIHYLDVTIYQALIESKASEHSARMMAMQNATDNAQDLVSDLTLAYNQIRQESITTELLEITSAQAALE